VTVLMLVASNDVVEACSCLAVQYVGGRHLVNDAVTVITVSWLQ